MTPRETEPPDSWILAPGSFLELLLFPSISLSPAPSSYRQEAPPPWPQLRPSGLPCLPAQDSGHDSYRMLEPGFGFPSLAPADSSPIAVHRPLDQAFWLASDPE